MNAMTATQVVEIAVGDAALLLNVTAATVRNLARSGKLHYRREHGTHRWLFPIDDVVRLAEYRRLHPERRGRRIPLRDLLTLVLAQERTQVATSARLTRQHHPRLDAKVDPRAVDGLSPSGGMPIDVHFRQKS
jgi:helix-turn-helix protein